MRPRLREWLAVCGLLLATSLVTASSALGANGRVGFIDSAKIFQDYKRAQDAQAQFDRQVQNWRNEATEKEKAVNALRAEVRDQAPILSSLKRQEKEEALQKAIQDYESFIQEIWGPQGRAAQENERSTREIVERIRTVVEKMASDKGLDLVLDAAGGMIIYADRSLDLSAEVVRELNTQDQSGKP